MERKERTIKELNKVIHWLTDFDENKMNKLVSSKAIFEIFFNMAKVNLKAYPFALVNAAMG